MGQNEERRVRAVAAPRQRGVAPIPKDVVETSRIYSSGRDDPPVFVDDTGRRRRLLTWLSVAFVVIALALVAALWISQVTAAR
jgi:hypothetical protein